jgi:hypothetical protein
MNVFNYLLLAQNWRASSPWRWPVAAQLLLLGALLANSSSAYAQAGPPAPQLRVSGTVSDGRTGQPLPGAAVRRLHTPRGVVANAEGDFLIPAYATDTLLFQALDELASSAPSSSSCAAPGQRHGLLARQFWASSK